jgi:hypothetical protein
MDYFYGIIEDRNDPQKLGRVRVRVFGIHSSDKSMIATPDLPWAQVMLPTTTASLSGFGIQHGLVEGSTVLLFFRDKETKQDPVVIGSVQGFNVQKRRKDKDGNPLGFNDPRRLTKSAYDGTVDGPGSAADRTRTFGLEGSLEESPVVPKNIRISYAKDGNSEITNPSSSEQHLNIPYYPLKEYINSSDISGYATGDADYQTFLKSDHLPDSQAAPKYPYNKSMFTESGHLVELDDTRDKERILVYHRSGTFTEIQPDGERHTRVVQNDYEVVCGDKEVTVCGDVKVVVKGNANIIVQGQTDITSEGNLSIIAPNIRLN